MELIKKAIKEIILLKFRTDNIAGFLVYVNFLLLVLTASPNIQKILNGWGIFLTTAGITALLLFMLVVCTIVLGYVMDVHGSYWQNMMTIQNKRNPEISQILINTEEIAGWAREQKRGR